MPSKRARKIPEKIEVFKEEKVQKEILKDESLPEDNEISLEELKDQEETEEDLNEPNNPDTSDKA